MSSPELEERIHCHSVKKKSKETRRKQAELAAKPGSLNYLVELDKRARQRPGYGGGVK